MANEKQMPPIAVEQREWELLASILRTHLPDCRVWAFGSRATRRHVRRFSDLDLAVEGREITLREVAMLDEVFDESTLPFKVDLTELAALAPEFRRRIEGEKVLLQEPSSPEKAA